MSASGVGGHKFKCSNLINPPAINFSGLQIMGQNVCVLCHLAVENHKKIMAHSCCQVQNSEKKNLPRNCRWCLEYHANYKICSDVLTGTWWLNSYRDVLTVMKAFMGMKLNKMNVNLLPVDDQLHHRSNLSLDDCCCIQVAESMQADTIDLQLNQK